MKKIKYILCLLLFILCLNVKAEETCSTDEMNRLKELANNVEIVKNLEIDDSRYDKENKIYNIGAYYRIKISNLTDDLVVFLSTEGQKVKIDQERVSNMAFENGATYTFYIYSYTDNSCTNKLLRTFTVKFDKYNLYYFINKEKCDKYPDFKYCKEYMNISNKKYDDIDKEFDEYIKENTVNENKFNLEDYYYIIGGVVLILLITLIIYSIIKRHKKNRL